MQLFNKVSTYINSGDIRSIKAKKNILQMIFTRGGTILVGLILVPLTLGYVDNETYGIWMTISSIVAWVQFFDIGIGNGLKNRLAEALANKDYILGRKYVSTTYAFLTLIFIPLAFLLAFIIPIIDWQSLLHISDKGMTGLVFTIEITAFYFCINFILSTINTIMTADQDPAGASVRSFVQQIVTLIVIFILTKTTQGSLVNLCIALCAIPIFIISLYNITLFKGKYNQIAPKISSIDFHVMPDLMKLGGQFFIIQIAVVIQYQLFNFLIMRYFGAAEVTAYNVSNKVFGVLYMAWGILITPLWVGITDAIAKNDNKWIRSTMIKYTKLCALFFLLCIFVYLLAPFLYRIWVGDKVVISKTLTLCLMFYNYNLIVSALATSFINGAGILKVQTIMSCITPFVFLGCSLLFIKIGFGIESIFISAIIANVNGIVIAPIQTINYIRKHV